METISLPPHAPTLMESTRAIGYSIESAIADIIDNSVAAQADRVDIDFFPIGESYISILDNGVGMAKEELINAMQYGSRSPLDARNENDLGRYGLGMKTASMQNIDCAVKKRRNLVRCTMESESYQRNAGLVSSRIGRRRGKVLAEFSQAQQL